MFKFCSPIHFLNFPAFITEDAGFFHSHFLFLSNVIKDSFVRSSLAPHVKLTIDLMAFCLLKTDLFVFERLRLAPWLNASPQRKELSTLLPALHLFGGPFTQESELLAQAACTGWVKTDRAGQFWWLTPTALFVTGVEGPGQWICPFVVLVNCSLCTDLLWGAAGQGRSLHVKQAEWPRVRKWSSVCLAMGGLCVYESVSVSVREITHVNNSAAKSTLTGSTLCVAKYKHTSKIHAYSRSSTELWHQPWHNSQLRQSLESFDQTE